MSRSRTGENGMTLAVMAAILAAVGALMVLGNALQHMRIEHQRTVTTVDRLDAVTEALVDFAMIHKRLPCPADAALETGEEALTSKGCAAPPDGTVPWRTLGVRDGLVRDRWGRKLGYRVADQGAALDSLASLDGIGLIVCAERDCAQRLYDPEQGTGAAFVLVAHGTAGPTSRAASGAPGAILDAQYRDDIVRATSFSELLVNLGLGLISAPSDRE